jgi:hypothetical protein
MEPGFVIFVVQSCKNENIRSTTKARKNKNQFLIIVNFLPKFENITTGMFNPVKSLVFSGPLRPMYLN